MLGNQLQILNGIINSNDFYVFFGFTYDQIRYEIKSFKD